MEPEAGDLATTARRTPAGDAFSAMVVRLIRLQGFVSAAGDALAPPSRQSTARGPGLAGGREGHRPGRRYPPAVDARPPGRPTRRRHPRRRGPGCLRGESAPRAGEA